MTLQLVTEARPIPWGRLSKDEQSHIEEAETWIDAVRKDASDQQFTPNSIDRNRSGRVLLIDGVRGSGKTSLMLTLLARLKGEEGYGRDDTPPKDTELRVLLPILDFDPLPRGMPIHGWLLEPWRREAETLEKETPSRGGADLTEQWAEVFERVVIGWARTVGESKGVIEKAIEYQEKAAGWIDTPTVWDKLVKSAVCRRVGCRKEGCKDNHPFVFVIAIDDVDLQVEHLPQLLHAIRLLHHPNVVYVLTAAFPHLSFVLELDYRQRHARALQNHHDEETWGEIRAHSRRLRDAFLEKAIPSHARVSLRAWSASEILGMAINSQGSTGNDKVPERDTVRARLAKVWSDIARDAGDLRIATARRAQHAIDRHMRSTIVGESPLLPEEEQLRFVADLCGTAIEKAETVDKDNANWRFVLNGQITTEQAATFRAWEGDRLTVMLTEQPSFAFLPDFARTRIQRADDANHALFLQLSVERQRAQALALTWSPDAGIAATEARWKPQSSKIEGRALFYWPWLARPSASDVLKLGKLARLMSGQSPGPSDITESMVALWLMASVNWQITRLNKSHSKPSISIFSEAQKGSLSSIARKLVELRRYPDMDAEVHRWVRELVVMTAPYFGLPKGIGEAIRKAIWIDKLKSDGASVLDEERKTVKDAIIRAQNGDARLMELTSEEFKDAVNDFLGRREEQSPSDGWWGWAGRSQSPAATGKRGTAKTLSARPKRPVRRRRRATGA